MKKNILLLTVIFCYCLFTACNTATPEDYFDIAVLNSNMVHGFANSADQRELESPSVKMVDGSKDKFEPMKRKEVVDSKIQFIEESFEKVKDLTLNLSMIENSAYRLAAAIKKTQKRANALKNITIPHYTQLSKDIADALEEKEREEFTRLKVIKQRKNKAS
mgnify:CR=1 FL=1